MKIIEKSVKTLLTTNDKCVIIVAGTEIILSKFCLNDIHYI